MLSKDATAALEITKELKSLVAVAAFACGGVETHWLVGGRACGLAAEPRPRQQGMLVRWRRFPCPDLDAALLQKLTLEESQRVLGQQVGRLGCMDDAAGIGDCCMHRRKRCKS